MHSSPHACIGGRTALHCASAGGHAPCVDLLVHVFHASLDKKDKDTGATPLHLAAAAGHVPVVRVLLEAGANAAVRNDKGKTPAELVVAHTHEQDNECASLFRQIDGQRAVAAAMVKAAERGNADELARLLKQPSANPNVVCDGSGKTALLGAVDKGRIECVRVLLLQPQGEANAVPRPAVHVQVDVNRANKDGKTALYLAVYDDRLAIAQLLVANGADVDRPSGDGKTPLNVAVYKGNVAMAGLLLQNGAKADYPDKGELPVCLKNIFRIFFSSDGKTPLHIACYKDNLACVDLLLKGGTTGVNAQTTSKTIISLFIKIFIYFFVRKQKRARHQSISPWKRVTLRSCSVSWGLHRPPRWTPTSPLSIRKGKRPSTSPCTMATLRLLRCSVAP